MIAGIPSSALYGGADRAGGHAVTAGVEAGTGGEEIRAAGANLVQHRRGYLVLMFDGIVVTADDRHCYRRIIAHELFEQFRRPQRAVAKFQWRAGMLFRADAAEKLIDVVNDAHISSFIGMKREFGFLTHASRFLQYTNDLIRDAPCWLVTPMMLLASIVMGPASSAASSGLAAMTRAALGISYSVPLPPL